MNASVITIIFIAFVIIGLLFGLGRGLFKSLIRLLTIIISAVVSTFLTGTITSSLINIDISSSNLQIMNVKVTTMQDTVMELLNSVPYIGELTESSPTLKAIIVNLPLAIINIFLFILVFFVVKFIFWIIYAIISKIFVKSKDSNGNKKKKHRLTGALVGAIQGIVCFAIVFMSVIGLVNFFNAEIDYVNNYNATQSVAYVKEVDYISKQEGNYITQTTVDNSNQTVQQVQQLSNTIADNWTFKFLNVFGYKKISGNVFDKLTQIKVGDEVTTLTKEFDVGIKTYLKVTEIKGNSLSTITEQDLNMVDEAVDIVYESKIIAKVVCEILNDASQTWKTDPSATYLGIKKLSIGGDFDPIIDNILTSFTTETTAGLKKDLKAVINTAKVIVKADFGGQISGGNSKTIIDCITSDNFAKDLIYALSTGVATQKAIPQVIESGLNVAYPLMNIKSDTSYMKVTADPRTIIWEEESAILGDIFVNIGDVYTSLSNVPDGGDLVDYIDYLAIGKMLNDIKESSIFASEFRVGGQVTTLGKELTIKLIVSNFGEYNEVSALIENSIRLNYSNTDFVQTLNTIGTTIKIANQMKEIGENPDNTKLNEELVGDLLTGLDNEQIGSIMQEVTKSENLQNLGIEKSEADAVSSIVDSVVEYNNSDIENKVDLPQTEEEKKDAGTAIQSIYEVVKNKDNLQTTSCFESKDQMREFLADSTQSNYVWAVCVNSGYQLGFLNEMRETNLTETEQTWAKEIAQETEFVAYKDGIYQLFGLSD